MAKVERPKVGIGVFILKGNRLLLGQRKNAHGNGEFGGPGGHLEHGESFEECALREIEEEAGPQFKVKNLSFLCLTNLRKYLPKHYVDVGIIAEWKSGKPMTMEPEKLVGWDWYDLSDLPSPLFGCEENYIEAHETGKHFGKIVTDINRTMLGYEILKLINRVTEDMTDSEYFDILEAVLGGLDNCEIDQGLIQLWLYLHLLKLSGHTPNLKTDQAAERLKEGGVYTFDLENMYFVEKSDGRYTSNHIKLLRLALGVVKIERLKRIQDVDSVLAACLQLVIGMAGRFIRA